MRKSYISELNSAYFVYNADDPAIKKFQEQRFEVLRNVKNYDNINPEIKAYYTFMPKDAKFDKIRNLAKEITKNASLPVDKIIAIRDYFLSKMIMGNHYFLILTIQVFPIFQVPRNSSIFYLKTEKVIALIMLEQLCFYYAL